MKVEFYLSTGVQIEPGIKVAKVTAEMNADAIPAVGDDVTFGNLATGRQTLRVQRREWLCRLAGEATHMTALRLYF